ncbi:MAG: hypothetical protein QXP53_00155 [Candidatus Pacearchaeota archaeon]
MLEKIVKRIVEEPLGKFKKNLWNLCLNLFIPLLFSFGSFYALNKAITAKMPRSSIPKYGRVFPPPIDLVIVKNDVEEDTSHFIWNREKDAIYRLGIREEDTNLICIHGVDNKEAKILFPGNWSISEVFLPTVVLHDKDSTNLTTNIFWINKGVDPGSPYVWVFNNSNKKLCQIEDTTTYDTKRSYFNITDEYPRPGDTLQFVFGVETFNNNIRVVHWPSINGKTIVPLESLVVPPTDTSLTRLGDVLTVGRPNTTIDLTLGQIVPIVTDGSVSVEMPPIDPDSAQITCYNSLDFSNWFIRNSSLSVSITNTNQDTIYKTNYPVDTIFPGESKNYNFKVPNLQPAGDYTLNVVLNVPTDTSLSNNFSAVTFTVTQQYFGWHRGLDLPGDKKCKKGTAMTVKKDGTILVAKGGTNEFWYLTPGATQWTQGPSLPGKAKYSALENCDFGGTESTYFYTSDGSLANHFYVLKGNTWEPRAEPSIDGKRPKAGTDLGFNSVTKKLCITGGGIKTGDGKAAIGEYNGSSWNWTGVNTTKNKCYEGAFIGFDTTGKGYFAPGKTNEFYIKPAGGQWTFSSTLNCGTKGKNKGDAAITKDGKVYHTPGNKENTWSCYNGVTWVFLPSWPSTGTKPVPKSPKVAYNPSTGNIEVLTVNNCNDHWLFTPASTFSSSPRIEYTIKDATQEQATTKTYAYQVPTVPTIMKASDVKKYTNNFEIYNINGQEIRTTADKVSNGVLFFRSKNTGEIYKVIIPE